MFSDRGSYSGESVYRNNEAGPVGWMKKRLEKKVHDFLSFNPLELSENNCCNCFRQKPGNTIKIAINLQQLFVDTSFPWQKTITGRESFAIQITCLSQNTSEAPVPLVASAKQNRRCSLPFYYISSRNLQSAYHAAFRKSLGMIPPLFQVPFCHNA